MMNETTALVGKAQQGDDAAFDALVACFQDKAVAYAYNLTGNRTTAEDVAQEAFFHAWRHLGTLREPAAFSGWLRRIIATCSNRYRRVQQEMVSLDDASLPEPVAPSAANPARIAEQNDIVRAVSDVLETLTPSDRDILRLTVLSGADLAETATFLDISVEAAKKRLQRARARCKERTVFLMQAEHEQMAPSKSARFVEIARLQRRIVELLEADPAVHAAYLSPFGSDEGFGAANDAWASLNVHVVCDDSVMDALATDRLSFVSRLGTPILWVEAPQNAPRHGYYMMVIYDAPSGPYEVDWYWHGKSTTEAIPSNARVLFNRANVPVGSEKQVWGFLDESDWPPALVAVRAARTQAEADEEELQNIIHFFWAMWLITAKYAARHPDQKTVGFAPLLQNTLKDVAGKLNKPGVELSLPENAPTLADKIAVLQTLKGTMASLGVAVPPVVERFLALIQSD